jgi:hypothetical protein
MSGMSSDGTIATRSDGTIAIHGVTHFIRKSTMPMNPIVWYGTTCGIRFSTCEPVAVDAKICFDLPWQTLTCIPCILGVISE